MISPKYSQDLFYIGPFYAPAFSQLSRLMVFDVDLEVMEDLSTLHNYFHQMESEESIAVALDQTGFYLASSEILDKGGLLKHIEDRSLLWGLNTGVVLYDLEKLRSNKIFQHQLQIENFSILSKSYGFSEHMVGDQEWFNLLMWKYPSLFKILPCEYNYQDTGYIDLGHNKCTRQPKILHQHGKIHDKS